MRLRLFRLCRVATAAALAGALVPSARAQQPAHSITDDPRVVQALELARVWLHGQRDYDQVPGVSAAIAYDQTTLWSGGFGWADVARRIPADAGTIYSICSISKLFTSIGVMQLRDEGKLRLDDPVAKHLAWFSIKRTYPDAGEPTIEGLLTHASGLPRESDYPYWSGPDFVFPTHEQIVQRLSSQEMLYPTETYFQYSNLGLTLAGEIVAAASGEPYQEYVARHILGPLGLTSTRPEMPQSERYHRLATGYGSLTRDGTRRIMPFFTANGITPAAGYSSTAEDLARFAEWQFRLLEGRDRSGVLAPNTLREMHRVHFVDPSWQTTYGLGFAVTRDGDHTFVGHGGSCPGYRTDLIMQPKEKIAVVTMANAQGVNTGQLAQRVYDIVAPAIRAAALDSARPKPSDPGLARYAGIYASGFSGEDDVLPWDDGLAVLSQPTSDPLRSLTKLRRVNGAEHTFRRVRPDGALGEQVVFQMGTDGAPERLIWNSNDFVRTADLGAAAPLAARPADVSSPDAIIAALYDVISGPAGQARDWKRFRSLFAPGARLIPTGHLPDGTGTVRVLSPDDYAASTGPNLEHSGFFEKEVARRVEQFGNVLQAFSTYESRRTATDARPIARGINSIQLVNDGKRWWVMTILWDAERPGNPIPPKYLPAEASR